MPTYTYQCVKCGKERDVVRPIAERHLLPFCWTPCGWPMQRVLSPTPGVVRNPAVPKT